MYNGDVIMCCKQHVNRWPQSSTAVQLFLDVLHSWNHNRMRVTVYRYHESATEDNSAW